MGMAMAFYERDPHIYQIETTEGLSPVEQMAKQEGGGGKDRSKKFSLGSNKILYEA